MLVKYFQKLEKYNSLEPVFIVVILLRNSIKIGLEINKYSQLTYSQLRL